MKIVKIANRRSSLEFEQDETGLVLAALKKLGAVVARQEADLELWEVAGQTFVRMNDWDSPCLISTSAKGDKILSEIVPKRARQSERSKGSTQRESARATA